MTVQALLDRLDGVRPCGTGRWSARCPAHADKSPSLSIREAGSRILLHCFGGCKPEEIIEALALAMHDLFTDNPIPHGQRPTPKPQKLDLVAVVHRFEMAALDRRIRADVSLRAVGSLNGDELSDHERDKLLSIVSRAFEDKARAEFLETVADAFRWKAFEEGRKAHAA